MQYVATNNDHIAVELKRVITLKPCYLVDLEIQLLTHAGANRHRLIAKHDYVIKRLTYKSKSFHIVTEVLDVHGVSNTIIESANSLRWVFAYSGSSECFIAELVQFTKDSNNARSIERIMLSKMKHDAVEGFLSLNGVHTLAPLPYPLDNTLMTPRSIMPGSSIDLLCIKQQIANSDAIALKASIEQQDEQNATRKADLNMRISKLSLMAKNRTGILI